jgi:hypothetical protein
MESPKISLNIWKGKTPYTRQEFNHISSAVLTVISVPQKADHTICQELPVYVVIIPNTHDATDKLAVIDMWLLLFSLLQTYLLVVTVAVAVAAVPVSQDVHPGVIPVLQRTEVRDEAGQFSLR